MKPQTFRNVCCRMKIAFLFLHIILLDTCNGSRKVIESTAKEKNLYSNYKIKRYNRIASYC